MKNLLQLLANLLAWWHISLLSLLGILWYGKLPKVSMYHWVKHAGIYKNKDVFEDINIQVFKEEQVPIHIKESIIDSYIDELYDNESFNANVSSINIPIFDGKDIIGNKGINYVLQEVKFKFLK
jgi:hypothetical protein